jgi:MinD-like ATPase involved in chromosome partitioning or flagellar assembly
VTRASVRAQAVLGRVPRGDRPLATAGHLLRRAVAGSAGARAALERAQKVAAPVPSGRRIVVAAGKDGAGRTTVAALLAGAFAARRPDPVLAVDAHLTAASLAWRLGLAHAPVMRELELYLLGSAGRDLSGVDAVLPRTATGVRLLADARGSRPDLPRDFVRALSRLFAVSVVDTGPGIESPWTDNLLADAHGIVLVCPATPEGVERTVQALADLDSGYGSVAPHGVTVVLNEAVPGSRLERGAARRVLGDRDVPVLDLGHDRHLAAGGPVDLRAVGRRTLEQVLDLAGTALERATGRVET